MKEEWLLNGAVVPVDVETTSELVAEIKRLIGVVGGMALAQPEPDWGALAEKQLASLKHDMRVSLEDAAVRATHKMMAELEQEPEFFTHCVDQPYDWSEWVCPDPKSYLFKCCDCGLVHEAEFGVVRYKSETEREDCDMVNDPNLQAVFRMRRSEQWSPEDTAHRAGGLTMEQPAQQEPVAALLAAIQAEPVTLIHKWRVLELVKDYAPPAQQEPVAWDGDCVLGHCGSPAGCEASNCCRADYTTPPQRKPLTDEQIAKLWAFEWKGDRVQFIRVIEAAHGIKENT